MKDLSRVIELNEPIDTALIYENPLIYPNSRPHGFGSCDIQYYL